MSVTRNWFLSTFGVARRLITAERARVSRTDMRRACSSTAYHRNTMFWRTVDKNIRMAHSMAQPTWYISREESHEMMAVWPDVVRDLMDMTKQSNVPDVTKSIEELLQYTVPGSKKNPGVSVAPIYKSLAPKDELTEENIRLARILGWCVEIEVAFLNTVDDLFDGSLYRRNKPCWYRHNGIGLAAINDGIILENFIYYLLKKHFKGKECYANLVETFQEAVLKTSMGQTLDLLFSQLTKKSILDFFTMDRYYSLNKHKAAYSLFWLSVIAAMHYAKVNDPELFRQTTTLILEIGHFYQVQDDYLDCYGEGKSTGKKGNDIEAGKCTWLVVQALQRVTKEQRKILEECYGFKEEEKIERVKQLYNDLELPNIYSIYEEEKYNLLKTQIQQISHKLLSDIFLNLLGNMYHRTS